MGVLKKKNAVKGTEGGVKYICDVCSADITSTVRIRCADVKCKDYDLCVPCFSQAKASREHDPSTHPYSVVEQHSVPIFTDDWGADEEMLLLEGAETYGLGSWADIADHIGGYRTKDEVRDHYISTYVESPKFPLPEHAPPKDRRLIDENPREQFQARKRRRIEVRKEERKNAPPAPPKQKPVSSAPSCHEVQGYMPGRLEFETEHNNEAEDAVQHMQFEPGEGIDPVTGEVEPEMVLKMTVMDIYNNRLTTRVERKRFIFEHQLLEYRRNTAAEKRKSNDERELLKKCKPLARLMRKTDFDEFTSGLEYELNLRQAIAQLQDWRMMQVADLKSGEDYETKKAARQAKIAAQNNYGLGPSKPLKNQPTEGNAAVASLVSPDLQLKAPGAPPGPPGAFAGSYGTLGANPVDSIANTTGGSSVNGAQTKTEPDARGTSAANLNGSATPAPPDNKIAATSLSVRPKFQAQPLPNTTPFKFTNIEATDPPPNSTRVEDLNILSEDEKEICSQLRIMPRSYTAIKDAIIREAIRQGGSMKKKAAKEVARIDGQKGGRLFDFFVHSGWVAKA